MAYRLPGRVVTGAALLLVGSLGAPACGSSGGAALGAGGEGGASGEPIDCERNADCPGALLCDRTAKLCVECLKDLDCSADSACLAGTCRSSCVSDKDCRATGQLCGDAGVCVDCITNLHCEKGEVCSDTGSCDSASSANGGTSSSGGAGASDAGAPGAGTTTGGTLNQGDAGMPSNTEAGSGNIGADCIMEPIDPCVGLPHFTATQTVDGDPSDFCDIPPFTLDMAIPPFYRLPKPPLSATTKATFRVGWSATALHVFVDVVDSAVFPNVSGSLANIWNGDNVEFYASPKTPAGLFNATRSYESGAFEVIAAPPGLQVPAGQAAYTSTGYAYAVPALQYKSSTTATGYTFEAQIFWTDAAPVAGTKMGFDAGLSDDIDGIYNAKVEYRDYYALLYNASYPGAGCSQYYEPYCDSRNWCVPTALP
jgi:hypothetical protein